MHRRQPTFPWPLAEDSRFFLGCALFDFVWLLCFVWLCLISLLCLTSLLFIPPLCRLASRFCTLGGKGFMSPKNQKRIFKIMVWVLLFWICSHFNALQGSTIDPPANTMQVLHQLRTFSRCRRDQRWEIGRMEKISTDCVLCRWRILACEKVKSKV